MDTAGLGRPQLLPRKPGPDSEPRTDSVPTRVRQRNGKIRQHLVERTSPAFPRFDETFPPICFYTVESEDTSSGTPACTLSTTAVDRWTGPAS